MAVRTKRLGSGSFNTSTVTVYTCPDGETAIVKYLTFHNPGASASTVTCRMEPSGSGSPRTFLRYSLAADEAKQFDTWLVLEPGDALKYIATLAGTNVAYTISGTELEGVAD